MGRGFKGVSMPQAAMLYARLRVEMPNSEDDGFQCRKRQCYTRDSGVTTGAAEVPAVSMPQAAMLYARLGKIIRVIC